MQLRKGQLAEGSQAVRGLNPAEVNLRPLGTIVLTNIGRNSAQFQVLRSLAGFESGDFVYLRLTQIEDIRCQDQSSGRLQTGR